MDLKDIASIEEPIKAPILKDKVVRALEQIKEIVDKFTIDNPQKAYAMKIMGISFKSNPENFK